jgi:hypothetical protein
MMVSMIKSGQKNQILKTIYLRFQLLFNLKIKIMSAVNDKLRGNWNVINRNKSFKNISLNDT